MFWIPPLVPICIKKLLVPFVEMPFSITVMRFTQDGIPVKSTLVPDVDATAVPNVITLALITGVPLIVGLLIVGLVNVLLVSV